MDGRIVSRSGLVTADFAGTKYRFRLAIGQLEELEEATGLGPVEMLAKLRAGAWRLSLLAGTIRLGLIGGGDVTSLEAQKLVERYVLPPNPLMENVGLATRILTAVLVGCPEDPPGKPGVAENP